MLKKHKNNISLQFELFNFLISNNCNKVLNIELGKALSNNINNIDLWIFSAYNESENNSNYPAARQIFQRCIDINGNNNIEPYLHYYEFELQFINKLVDRKAFLSKEENSNIIDSGDEVLFDKNNSYNAILDKYKELFNIPLIIYEESVKNLQNKEHYSLEIISLKFLDISYKYSNKLTSGLIYIIDKQTKNVFEYLPDNNIKIVDYYITNFINNINTTNKDLLKKDIACITNKDNKLTLIKNILLIKSKQNLCLNTSDLEKLILNLEKPYLEIAFTQEISLSNLHIVLNFLQNTLMFIESNYKFDNNLTDNNNLRSCYSKVFSLISNSSLIKKLNIFDLTQHLSTFTVYYIIYLTFENYSYFENIINSEIINECINLINYNYANSNNNNNNNNNSNLIYFNKYLKMYFRWNMDYNIDIISSEFSFNNHIYKIFSNLFENKVLEVNNYSYQLYTNTLENIFNIIYEYDTNNFSIYTIDLINKYLINVKNQFFIKNISQYILYFIIKLMLESKFNNNCYILNNNLIQEDLNSNKNIINSLVNLNKKKLINSKNLLDKHIIEKLKYNLSKNDNINGYLKEEVIKFTTNYIEQHLL